jgi:IrrE N-terminal-like domain
MSFSLPQARYLTIDQIEREVEYQLNYARLMPTAAGPVDIEAFLEHHLNVCFDQYADLDSDVLGLTYIPPGKRPHVLINRDLTLAAEDDMSPLGIKGRWRATCAHEGAHVIFHRTDLEAAAHQQNLFAPDPLPNAALPRQTCLKRDFGHVKGTTNRREIQANLGMAALLMPRPVFEPAARALAEAIKPLILSPEQRLIMMVQRLAPLFEVSKIAVRIRLETFKFHQQSEYDQLYL